MYWTCNSMNNMLSYCGLVDAKISASDKDLPVLKTSYHWVKALNQARITHRYAQLERKALEKKDPKGLNNSVSFQSLT